jgi:hypothetical protein
LRTGGRDTNVKEAHSRRAEGAGASAVAEGGRAGWSRDGRAASWERWLRRAGSAALPRAGLRDSPAARQHQCPLHPGLVVCAATLSYRLCACQPVRARSCLVSRSCVHGRLRRCCSSTRSIGPPRTAYCCTRWSRCDSHSPILSLACWPSLAWWPSLACLPSLACWPRAAVKPVPGSSRCARLHHGG